MPAYNSSKYISETIDSIIHQTHKDWELIIINDGSTDNTFDIIETYAKNNEKIKIFTVQNSGVSAARNFGVDQSKYNWLAFCDSDDLWLSNKLEKQCEFIEENPDVGLVASAFWNMGSLGNKGQKVKNDKPNTIEEFHKMNLQGVVFRPRTSTVVVSKDIFNSVGGFNHTLTVSEDTDLFDRIAQKTICICLPEPLMYYRLHTSSLSSQQFRKQFMTGYYMELRAQKRVQGKALDYNEFLTWYESVPLYRKLARWLNMNSRLFYRNAGSRIANRNYFVGTTLMVTSFLFNPFLIGQRIWKKILS